MEEPDDLQPIDEEEEEAEFATIAGAATIEQAKGMALDQLRKLVPYVNPATSSASSSKRAARAASSAAARARPGRGSPAPVGERVDVDLPPGADLLRDFIQTTSI